MIVRISTEGQYRLSSAVLDQLNEIDNRIVQIVGSGDSESFQKALAELLDLVRSKGSPVASSDLVASDIILPAPDVTLEDARDLFSGEGLVPA